MTKTVKDIQGIEEACWVGYKKVGMKKKGDRMVPNCVNSQEGGKYRVIEILSTRSFS